MIKTIYTFITIHIHVIDPFHNPPTDFREAFNLSLALQEPRHDKTNKMSVPLAKTQINLGIRPV